MSEIKAAYSVQELDGIGLEFLLDELDGTIRAEFFDGNFVRALVKPGPEQSEIETLVT